MSASVLLDRLEKVRQTGPGRWIAQRRYNRKDGRIGWDLVGYYTTFGEAVNGLAQHRVRMSDVTTVADALAKVENVVATLCYALRLDFELTVRHKNGRR